MIKSVTIPTCAASTLSFLLQEYKSSDRFQNPADGEVNQVKVNNEDDAAAVCSLAVTSDGSKVITGSENNFVKQFTLPKLEALEPITRLTAPVTYVALSPDDKVVAVGSTDSMVRLYDAQSTASIAILEGHNGNILSLSFDPLNEYIASTSEDGSLKIWNVKNATCLKTIQCTSSSNSDMAVRPAWHGKGQYLAVPGATDGSIKVYERTSWKLAFELTEGHDDTSSDILCWSSNGLYLLSAGLDFKIYLWDVPNKKVLRTLQWDAAIRAMQFRPKMNQFVFMDEDSRFAIVNNVIPMSLTPPQEAPEKEPVYPSSSATSAATASKPAVVVDDNETQMQVTTAAPAPTTTKNTSDDMDIAPEAVYEDDDDVPINRKELKRLKKKSADDDDDEKGEEKVEEVAKKKKVSVDDGDNVESLNYIKKNEFGFEHFDGEERTDEVEKLEALELAKEMNKKKQGGAGEDIVNFQEETFEQVAFQSSETPMENRKRFLCWNSVGVIISRVDEFNRENHIDIEFNDITIHRNERFVDHRQFHKGVLSDVGAFFASPRKDIQDIGDDIRDAEPSRIYYRCFDSWAGAANSNWEKSLPLNEDAVAVAVGDSDEIQWAAVATDRNWVRVFRSSGIQLAIQALPGGIVSMAGCGNYLAVAYHRSAPTYYNHQQRIGYVFYDVLTMKRISEGPLPLSKDSELSWFGFDTDKQILCAQDSEGVLLLLSPAHSFAWLPLMDFGSPDSCKSGGNKHWIVSILDKAVNCIVLRGEQEFPQCVPRPLLSTIPLKMPILDVKLPNGELEEQMIRSNLYATIDSMSDVAADSCDSTILRWFINLLKVEKDALALDLANHLEEASSYEIAIKAAGKYKRYELINKIQELKESKFSDGLDSSNMEEDVYGGGGGSGQYQDYNPSRGSGGNKRQADYDDQSETVSKKAKVQKTYSGNNENQGHNSNGASAPIAANPFMKKKVNSPAKVDREKSLFGTLSGLKSPDPKITPKLNRESSIAKSLRH